jgi:hypothetical protein
MSRDKKAHHDLTFVLAGARGFDVVSGVDPSVVGEVLDTFSRRVMSNEILLLSGPNLDRVGFTQPRGLRHRRRWTSTWRGFASSPPRAGFSVRHVQSNFEGDLIEAVHAPAGTASPW